MVLFFLNLIFSTHFLTIQESNCFSNLVVSTLSSIVSNLIAAWIFWHFVQNRLQNLISSQERKRVCGNLLNELIYNRMVATQNLKKDNYFKLSKRMTVLNYETEKIDDFLTSQPLNLEKGFYTKLQIFNSASLKSSNKLLEIFWFAPKTTDEDLDKTRDNIIHKSKVVIDEIDKILENKKFIKEMENFGLKSLLEK